MIHFKIKVDLFSLLLNKFNQDEKNKLKIIIHDLQAQRVEGNQDLVMTVWASQTVQMEMGYYVIFSYTR